MKINEISFQELLEAKHEPENLRPIAEAYWRAMLVFAMIGVVGVVLFGIWEFRTVMAKITTQADVTNAPSTNVLDRTQLEQVLRQYDARRSAYEAKVAAPLQVVDPSVK